MTVVVTKVHGARPTCYHTDRDCSSLREESETREYDSLEALPWDVPVCKWCSGEADNSESDMSHYQALKAAANRGESA